MITYIYVWISLVVWWLVWYFAFYLTFKEVKTIQWIKEKLAKSLKEIEDLKTENDKMKDENKILREKWKELLEKYDDMSRVIAELSRYSKILKEWWEIAKKLAEKLWVYDAEIHDRMQRVLHETGIDYDDEEEGNTDIFVKWKAKKIF